MCTNYRPTSRELLDDYFGAPAPNVEFREEAYPGYKAPIIRLAHEDGQRGSSKECIAATFGLIPAWSKDGKNYRFSYNARTAKRSSRSRPIEMPGVNANSVSCRWIGSMNPITQPVNRFAGALNGKIRNPSASPRSTTIGKIPRENGFHRLAY